jgi:hypothetical protein
MKSFSIRFLLFIAAAELIASFAVWHGTPTDWKGQPPSFWYFEMLRLRYWCAFGLAFAILWVVGWLGLRRVSTTVIPIAVAVLCALATEVITSVYFLRSLRPDQASYLGWYDSRIYFREHLFSWVVLLVVFLICLWYLGHRQRQLRGTVPGIEGNVQHH